MTRIILLVCSLLGSAHARSAHLPIPGPTINIVEWDGNDLPPVYERSEQVPIDHADLLRLLKSGFQPDQVAQMIVQRRYAGDVSAEGLISLRDAGFSDEVIGAASLHALPPNRSINLSITLEIDGQVSSPRSRYLYIIIQDGDIERVFTANLDQVFGGRWQSDTMIDHSDLLIPRSVRTVTFTGTIPLKEPGPKTLKVFTSTRPDIHWLTEVSSTARQTLRTHLFDYPVSSIRNDCRLLIRLFQDRVLEDNWTITGTHLECEWN